MKKDTDLKRWHGPRATCDLCKVDISKSRFVDGKVRGGPWALMCPECYQHRGMGLGTGLGQMYNEDGIKIAG